VGYVEDHLLEGEELMYRAHLHRIIYVVPALFAVAGVVFAIVTMQQSGPLPLAIALIVLGLLPIAWARIVDMSSEFAVTDRRVIIKVGFIQRRTLETMLSKVEGIGVDQGVFGRLVNLGTVTVTGTGGTHEQFKSVAAPLEFRRQVQTQISRGEDARGAIRGSGESLSSSPRDERDCPFCAERILARAKVCKHCGRDVEPFATA
jgi:uncharacterized membrane protein YdbT with pleckstrin-like domain